MIKTISLSYNISVLNEVQVVWTVVIYWFSFSKVHASDLVGKNLSTAIKTGIELQSDNSTPTLREQIANRAFCNY